MVAAEKAAIDPAEVEEGRQHGLWRKGAQTGQGGLGPRERGRREGPGSWAAREREGRGPRGPREREKLWAENGPKQKGTFLICFSII